MTVSTTEAGQILDKADSIVPTPTGVANKDVQPLPSTPKEEPISPKLAVLMERERQALNREKMAKTQEEKLRERLQKVEQFESVKKDPKKALEFLGLSYDELTQSILKDGEIPPSVEIKGLRDEIDQLKEQLKLKAQTEAEEQQKKVSEQETRAVSEFKSEINDYLKSNAQRYELIDFEQANELVYEVIDEHYNRTIDQTTGVGKVMPIQEAADRVEEYLEKKYLAAKEKNKVKAFWSNMPKGLQDQLKKQEVSQPLKTLTNNLGPRVSQKVDRPPEDKRIEKIVQEHMAKMRSQFAG